MHTRIPNPNRKKKSNINKYIIILLIVVGFIIGYFLLLSDSNKGGDRFGRVNINTKPTIENKKPSSEGEKIGYGIVLDLGSSGSRIHVYQYIKDITIADCIISNDDDSNTTFKDLIEVGSGLKVKPGVSSYADNPKEAAQSLKPLIQYSLEMIPHEYVESTPIYLFATAGLRVLATENGEEIEYHDTIPHVNNKFVDNQQAELINENGVVENILKEIRNYIQQETEYLIPENNVRILSGREEGTFDYITVQILLKNGYRRLQTKFEDTNQVQNIDSLIIFRNGIGRGWNTIRDGYPIGTLDLGGASTQISFIYDNLVIENTNQIPEEDDLAVIDLFQTDDNKQTIFTHSFLDYGINRARERFIERIIMNFILHHPENSSGNILIDDPCSPADYVFSYTYKNTNYDVIGTGEYQSCKDKILEFLDVSFSEKHYTFNQIPIPPINDQLYFLAFDHANRVANFFGIYGFAPLQSLKEKTIAYCNQDMSTILGNNNGLQYSDLELMKYCFEGVYIESLFHDGYKFDSDLPIIGFADYIEGNELNWSTGAIAYELNNLCKNKNI